MVECKGQAKQQSFEDSNGITLFQNDTIHVNDSTLILDSSTITFTVSDSNTECMTIQNGDTIIYDSMCVIRQLLTCMNIKDNQIKSIQLNSQHILNDSNLYGDYLLKQYNSMYNRYSILLDLFLMIDENARFKSKQQERLFLNKLNKLTHLK